MKGIADHLVRRGEVEGRLVGVFDGLLDPREVQRLVKSFEASPFARTESARPDTREHRHWVLNLSPEVGRGLSMLPPSLAAVQWLTGGRPYRDYRSYCNYASFGDVLLTHTDAQPGSDEYTALWFLCDEWSMEWGGETLFFDSKGDVAFAVSPRPGRLAVFDGSITHCGRPPTRICHAARYTFAYKLERVPGL